MSFSISTRSKSRDTGSHTVHTAISRDYDRKKLAAKQQVKLEKDFHALERKMMSNAKWNQRAESNNLRPNPSPSTSSLDNYIQKEKSKQDNMINSKRMANERIRRSSVNVLPKA
jgi:hypothetical protein